MLMIREFDPGRMEKKNTNYQKHYKTLIESAPGNAFTIYVCGLKALLCVLKEDFQVAETVAKLEDWSSNRSVDFLGSIGAQVMMEEFEVLKKIPDIECMIDGEEEHSFGW